MTVQKEFIKQQTYRAFKEESWNYDDEQDSGHEEDQLNSVKGSSL